MPIYEYKCEICGQIFEKLIYGAEEEEAITCTKCGDKQVSRVMSVTGILASSCTGNTKGFS